MRSLAGTVTAIVLGALATVSVPAQSIEGVDAPCSVTTPNGTPATGQRASRGINRIHGVEALSVTLTADSTSVFRPGGPGAVLPDGALRIKYPMYQGMPGRIGIQGRRLDAPAAPLRAEIPAGYGSVGLQPVSLIFPTPGCWEVTSSIGDASLTFVVRVIKVGEGPVRLKG
jgi:hypothetical protein